MTTAIRPELETLPSRLQRLPVDERGYPVPWFVDWVDGKPEFRAADPMKWERAVKDRLCWVCGEKLGAHLTFVIGPMCGINRVTAEPACHLECAEWSARNCPFLARPHMVRREDEVINNDTLREQSAGTALPRNPGVTLLWTTKSFRLFPDGKGRFLIQVGDPTRVQWFAHGRLATRAEVEASVESGLPALMALAEAQDRKEGLFGEPMKELLRMKASVVELYPPLTFPLKEAVMVRAKFTVSSVTKNYYAGKETGGVSIKLTPQYDDSIEEDRRYAKATPSGEITLYVDNPPAAAALIEGGVFYVDFTAVPKPEPAAV